MPVTIGSNPDHDFEQPLGLMRDCHRRIEKFLGVLLRVVTERGGGRLGNEHERALAAALRYFQEAAPWHTRDEEESLFPRMRELGDPRVRAALANIDRLESDHADAEARHAAVDRLGRQWLTEGGLPPAEAETLRGLLEQLQQMYQRHIAEEDDVIFPLAEQTLPLASLKAVGREMAQRRGLNPARPEPRCRHARANR